VSRSTRSPGGLIAAGQPSILRLVRRLPRSIAALAVAFTVALGASACHRAASPAPDTLVVLQERDAQGLDPHTGGNLWQTQIVLANVYEGLVAIDPGMRVVPALATSWTNPDNTTLELALRPGVRAHDGSTLTADDVLFSLERAGSHPRSLGKSALAAGETVGAARPGPGAPPR
jgi:peptide/nickel transport system substrate-binding protein